ncbi:MAG: LysM peptidoglycan-binding domain-containing M23 family metallopeptidase [Alphaproteobacteria bacterium]|nr:LysM peptidoglycan-binding domain-containing M23 family metallopeptidase [Alphaproteobacteria bacterium]
MKKFLCLVPCALSLAACDLQPMVVNAIPGKRGDISEQTAKVSDYGAAVNEAPPTPAMTEMYGAAVTEYADRKDYVAPKTEPKSPPAVKNTPAPVPEPAPAEPEDILLVPARAAVKPKPVVITPEQAEVVVAQGDTVYSISRKTGVPVRDLIAENKLAAPYTLSIGRKLQIPGAKFHTVRAGETLYSISRAYGVDLNSLARENNIAAPYGLVVGQRLRLPGAVAIASAPISKPEPESAGDKKTAPDAKPAATTKPVAGDAAPVITEAKTISSKPTGKLQTAPSRAGAKFSWPVQGRIISPFGSKKNGLYNDGINIAAAAGTPVKAAENGVVAYAGNELKGMGNLVIIQHSGGWMTVYAHLDTMTVRRGKRVNVGEKIGTVGSTGKISEPQLHFEIRKGTQAFNPSAQLKK